MGDRPVFTVPPFALILRFICSRFFALVLTMISFSSLSVATLTFVVYFKFKLAHWQATSSVVWKPCFQSSPRFYCASHTSPRYETDSPHDSLQTRRNCLDTSACFLGDSVWPIPKERFSLAFFALLTHSESLGDDGVLESGLAVVRLVGL